MTVAALPASVTYAENGVTTSFAVPFRFKAAGDLIVSRIAAGVETVWRWARITPSPVAIPMPGAP